MMVTPARKVRGRKRGCGSQSSVESAVSGSTTSLTPPHKKAHITPPPTESHGGADDYVIHRAGGTDGGGCMHKALNKCKPGVLCVEELDEQITNVHEEKNKKPEWAPDMYKLEWCGTPGQSWHQDCIFMALRKKYPGRFSWLRHPTSVIFERGRGKFYVHGFCL